MSRADKVTAIQSELQTFSTSVYLFQQQIAEKMKLHPTDFHTIHLLDKHGVLTAGQLAGYLGLTSGATTTAIDRLVNLGYVERAPSDSDRRSTIIRLRVSGIQKMKRAYSNTDKQVQDGLKQFSDDELVIVERFLEMLTNL